MSRAYAELPEGVRWLDAQQGPTPEPLRRFVDSYGDDLDTIAGTIYAVATVPGRRSLLVDPDNAPASWLPWMGQLVGASLAGATTVAQQRAAVRGASGGWLSGTMAAIESAVRVTLTDPYGYVAVYRDAANPWLLHVVTKATQTPSSAAALESVVKAGAKPAGVLLDWTAYAVTWGAVEPLTWYGIEGLGSWDALEAYS